MARMIPAVERLARARKLLQEAHDLPKSTDPGWGYFSYVAGVKDLCRQARDLIKFIPNTPSASAELKKEVADLFQEIDAAEKAILHS